MATKSNAAWSGASALPGSNMAVSPSSPATDPMVATANVTIDPATGLPMSARKPCSCKDRKKKVLASAGFFVAGALAYRVLWGS